MHRILIVAALFCASSGYSAPEKAALDFSTRLWETHARLAEVIYPIPIDVLLTRLGGDSVLKCVGGILLGPADRYESFNFVEQPSSDVGPWGVEFHIKKPEKIGDPSIVIGARIFVQTSYGELYIDKAGRSANKPPEAMAVKRPPSNPSQAPAMPHL